MKSLDGAVAPRAVSPLRETRTQIVGYAAIQKQFRQRAVSDAVGVEDFYEAQPCPRQFETDIPASQGFCNGTAYKEGKPTNGLLSYKNSTLRRGSGEDASEYIIGAPSR